MKVSGVRFLQALSSVSRCRLAGVNTCNSSMLRIWQESLSPTLQDSRRRSGRTTKNMPDGWQSAAPVGAAQTAFAVGAAALWPLALRRARWTARIQGRANGKPNGRPPFDRQKSSRHSMGGWRLFYKKKFTVEEKHGLQILVFSGFSGSVR